MLHKISHFITGSPLRTRVLTLFIILASAPILILGGSALDSINISHSRDVSNLELQLIDVKIEEITKFFSSLIDVLEIRVSFKENTEIPIPEQEFVLEGLMEENPAFEEVSFINLQGQETTKRAKVGLSNNLINVSRLQKFSLPSVGENYIGDVYYTLSGYYINIAVPVKNRGGDIIQILSSEIDLAPIAHLIETAQFGGSGYLAILDQGGTLIASYSQSPITPGTPLYFHKRIERALKKEMFDGLRGEDRYISFISSIPVVGAARVIPDLNWVIMAEWPIVDADALINNVRSQIIWFTIGSILGVLMLAPVFVSRLIHPIRELQKEARAIGQGDFEQKVSIKTHDELQELGDAFNQMAQGLKRLQELKDEFVFVAAHELRTPVTVIRGYISMVMKEHQHSLEEEVKNNLIEAQNASNRLNQLVDDLLQVARSEAGRITITLKPIDIRGAIRAALLELKPLADQKSITLNYIEDDIAPEVNADENSIKEVIVNLVNNAIKYTDNGGSILVTHETAGGELITRVKDSGFGISKDAQKKLFEKFYRVQTKKTYGIPGTGLGLFIVKQIIEKMNGQIWVESEEGKGSTFSFSLKLAQLRQHVS